MSMKLKDTAAINISGNAATSSKLGTTDVGSATQPIYLEDGVATPTTYTLGKSVPSDAKFTDTDTKVTSVGNHYTPAENTDSALSASGGSATNITGTAGKLNVVTGLKRDAKGHVVGVTSANIYSTDNNTTYSSKSAASGGTDVSLVTTGEKYTWNSKTSNTGTVTKVSTGKGLTGGNITTTGTIKCNLNSETSLGTIGTTSKLYAVGVDANNKLCVNVPWTDNNTTYSAATTSAAGLMSAADKTKLDGITASADTVSFSRSLTSGTKIGTITINGTGTDLYCQTNTNTTYSAGTGLALSGTSFYTTVPRVAKSCNSIPGANKWVLEEYIGGANYNLPSNAFYHIYTAEGSDTNYATQLALGMTTTAAYYRNYNNKSWSAWKSIINTNTTYSLVGANGTTGLIKNGSSVTSTSGLTACPIISGVPYYKDTNTTYTLSSLGIANVKNYDQSKAIKAITRSGTTFTYTCLDGTTGTFTQQDNNTTYSVATASANGLMAAADKSLTNFLNATSTATTLASLNVSKSTIYATLSKATTISLSGTLTTGRSITVICKPTASFTQPIPTSGSFISMDGDSLSVTSGKFFEINIYAYASGAYSISCKTAK